MAFNVHPATIRRFELPLDQKIGVVAVLVLSKRDLEILAVRTRDGNVRERELSHSAPRPDSTAGRFYTGRAGRRTADSHPESGGCTQPDLGLLVLSRQESDEIHAVRPLSSDKNHATHSGSMPSVSLTAPRSFCLHPR